MYMGKSIDPGDISLKEGEIRVPWKDILSSSPEGFKKCVDRPDDRCCLMEV